MNLIFLKNTPTNVVENHTYGLLESWGRYDPMYESADTGNLIKFERGNKFDYKHGEVYICGTFMQADIVNGNKRVYPRSLLDRAINQYMESRVKNGKALGEWEHPSDRVEADHTKAVLLIEDLWWEGNDVKGRAILSTGDYAEGDKIASLMRIGWRPSVSSRGVGRLHGNMAKDGYMTVADYRISVGIDIVNDPSAPDANVEVIGLTEGLESSISMPINNGMKKNEGSFDVTTLINRLKNYGN